MQKIIVFILLSSIVFQSTPVFAGTQEDFAVLQVRVQALTEYIQRLSVANNAPQKPLSNEIIKTSIESGVSWLVHAQEENGHFAYEYLPYEDRYREDDNIVRQAGALYAFGEVVRRSKKNNKETHEAIEKAIGYFVGLSPEHGYEGREVRCITKNEDSKLCKLGATSLALIGILGYIEAEPTKAAQYEALITEYSDFILAAKKENAGFTDQYIVGSGFRGEAESPFSNGEALLALVRYYKYTNNLEVKKIIDDSFVYLSAQPFDSSLYLWMMAALKDMHALWPQDTYTEYGTKFTLWRLRTIQPFHNSRHNYCPATEGFASAYSLLENTPSFSLLQKLKREIDFWNAKNRGLQVALEESVRLSVIDGKPIFNFIRDSVQSAGGFLTSDAVPTQRIDFTQHCITAYVQTLVDIHQQAL